jgi:hypothetical protein
VLGGDSSRADLERWHRDIVVPSAKAMAAAYFNTPPDQPVTILLFRDEQSYRRHARRLFAEAPTTRFGYYRPHLRTIVLNASAGAGPLRHELTHALAAFDFPAMPAWLNEGLASLHEACHVSPTGDGLVGEVNWRLGVLQTAMQQNDAHPLPGLFAAVFQGGDVGLRYSEARYFCLYLQRQGLLRDFYHLLRDEHRSDLTGAETARRLLGGRSWQAIDARFRQWVLALSVDCASDQP